MSTELSIAAPPNDQLPQETTSEMGECVRKCEDDQKPALSDVQFRAIRLTIGGKNDTEISAALDISRRTLWDWKTNHAIYRATLASLRTQLRDNFSDRCQVDLISAASTLMAFMNEAADVKIRLRAAEILFRHGARYLHNNPPQRAEPLVIESEKA